MGETPKPTPYASLESQRGLEEEAVTKKSEARSESGIALIAVLWITILLSVLATALIAMSRSDARQLTAEEDRLQANEAAQAGINLALLSLSDAQMVWSGDQITETFRFNEIDVTVIITSENGKIDLNTGDEKLISGLLVVAGASPGEAGKITSKILGRRNAMIASAMPLPSSRTNPAENPISPFETVGELLQIPGMSRELFDRAAPNFTLYSGSPSVDIRVASRDVLLAIPGNTQADVEAAMVSHSFPNRRNDATTDLSRIIGGAFAIKATARSQSGTISLCTKVIRLTGDSRQPVWVLSTQEY